MARWDQGSAWHLAEADIEAWLDSGDRRQVLAQHLADIREDEELRRMTAEMEGDPENDY